MNVPRFPSSVFALSLVAVLVASGAGMAAAEASAVHPAQASSSLTVTVGTALSFTLSTDEVTPGDTVTVTITQTSDVAHTFTLLNAPDFQFNSTDSGSHIMAFLAAHPPLVNVSIPGTPGTLPPVQFVAPAFGLYQYLCLIPGHFQAGMWGILGSGEPGTGGAAPNTGPGAAVFIIAGTIASLVVIAIVLGFVIGRRKGGVHEMPPERLGYPEPAPPSPPAQPPSTGRT